MPVSYTHLEVEEGEECQALCIAECGAGIEPGFLREVPDPENGDERRILEERDQVVSEGRQNPTEGLGKEDVP